MTPPVLLTAQEVAERLHAPRRAVLHAIRTGNLQGVRGLGRSVWLVSEDALERYAATWPTVLPQTLPGEEQPG